MYTEPCLTQGEGSADAAKASKPALPMVGEGAGAEDEDVLLEELVMELELESEDVDDGVGDEVVEKVV